MTIFPLGAIVLAAAALFILGWTTHVAWLRARTRTAPTGDGRWAVLQGRAVAGIWDTLARARAHAAHMRRQIGGRR